MNPFRIPDGPAQGPRPARAFVLFSAAVVVLLACVCLACMLFGAGLRAPWRVYGPPPPPAAREYIPHSCDEVAASFRPGSSLTQLQKDDLWQRYRGRWVRWSARVEELHGPPAPLTLRFECGGSYQGPLGLAHFAPGERERLLRYRVGDTVRFEGRLGPWTPVGILEVDDATVADR